MSLIYSEGRIWVEILNQRGQEWRVLANEVDCLEFESQLQLIFISLLDAIKCYHVWIQLLWHSLHITAEQEDRTEDLEDQIEEITELALGEPRCSGVIAGGYCYYLHNQRYNIRTASSTCREKESNLTTITTEHQYQAVLEYIRSSDVITDRSLIYVWTGYNLTVGII